MPRFRYQALDREGRAVEGTLEAASVERVLSRLRAGGALPIQVEEQAAGDARGVPAGARARRRRVRAPGKPREVEVGAITRDLATLLGAGLPLDRSLQVLVETAPSARVEHTITDVRDRVRGGATLSDALEAQEKVFSRLYLAMVRAGEAGGNLSETLSRLSEYLERSHEVRERVVSALIYPALLLGLAVVSLLILLTFVVPQFTAMFDDLGASMPLPTRIVVAAGGFLQAQWPALLAGVSGCLLALRWLLDRPALRLRFDGWLLRLAVVGELVRRIDTARLARTLGSLLRNGVPLLGALATARDVLLNQALARALGAATDAVRHGKGLAGPLAASGLFPAMAVHMVRLGEETGRLDDMLIEVASTFERESARSIDRLLSMLVPVLILVLALLIGGIVVSMLLAILGANELLI
jgi:general secretion pathway protein F